MAEQWRNTHGLDQAVVERLLDEFHAALYETFATYRQFHGHLWPGYEEYAVLYSDHYEGRSFGYRYTLPPPGTPTQPVAAGYMANAYVRMRHPDFDTLHGMLDDVGRTVRVHVS